MARTIDSRQLAKIIGANLKFLRKQRFPGWGGQRRFADFLNLSPNDLCVYEYGRSAPNEQRLEEIAARLELGAEQLRTPLPGVKPDKGKKTFAEADADESSDSGITPEEWRLRVEELERQVARLEGRIEVYEKMEERLNSRVNELQEANFILRNLLYVEDTPEARERRDKVLERLGPSMSEMVKLHEAF